MPYELRVPGEPAKTFETEPEAIAAAKELLLQEPNAAPELIDLATGNEAAPGASPDWREDLRTRVGF
jgi:hypothetical protein